MLNSYILKIKTQVMFRSFVTFLLLLFSVALFGQMKPRLEKPVGKDPVDPRELSPVMPLGPGIAPVAPFSAASRFRALPVLPKPVKGAPGLKAYLSDAGTPYLIEGVFENGEEDPEALLADYFTALQPVLGLKEPLEELILRELTAEASGQTHYRFQQVWQGVPVYGAEVAVHRNAKGIYLFNGRFYPSPAMQNVEPQLDAQTAAQLALQHAGQYEPITDLSAFDPRLTDGQQTRSELAIYYLDRNPEREFLAWHVTVTPNITARYSYFIDAHTGEVLHYQSELCKIAGHAHGAHTCAPPPDGPYTANATDLFGQTRTINTYCKNNVFFLIDASQTMFNNTQSTFPDDPVGTIWTLDAQNTSPQNSNFALKHLSSSNNNWSNPNAVSAHYHAEKAYDYFKNTFNRESINGQGSNIISMINVADVDNSPMDNAFWNGFAMFYGNGNQAFLAPLSRALDVAGHELSHGVIQHTANLEYMGESGAMNESYADIFGAMIDRDDWQMGEDVVNPAVFPSGALRDMADPHNGGNSLSDPGWQPAHYSERYTGNQDNGGVHINSGIINRAYYLFASSVGKEKAEQVFYRALDVYLLKSSIFIDCRNAVVQAATDLYGATEANAAKSAFEAVGIGAGAGTDPTTDINTNPGEDFILMSDAGYSALYIFTPEGAEVANPLSSISPLSRPSVTDDGSAIVYIAEDQTMRAIFLDWQTGNVTEQVVQGDPIWRNVAVSKNGERLAALTTDNDNVLWIYDYGVQQWKDYALFNPTTGQGGPTTGDVLFADVIEWDFTGQWVMYDAFNSLNSTFGTDIEYWDIGFIEVWGGNYFSAGHIEKLFSGLPEGVSIGNPTFSKNSDYILAFDYIDEYYDEYYLLAANIQSGEVGTIFENEDLSWPNYSVNDQRLVFDAYDNFGTPVLAFQGLASDKISPSGNPTIYLEQGRWGVWFANGDRPINTTEILTGRQLRLSPNPASDVLTLQFDAPGAGETLLQVFDLRGLELRSESLHFESGANTHQLDLSDLPAGMYLVRLSFEEGQVVGKVMVE
jgi:Zn-dependent metalloprotease